MSEAEKIKAAVAAERERCAQIADALSAQWWAEYKDRKSPHAGSDHYQGMSDGADNVAAAIRGEAGRG